MHSNHSPEYLRTFQRVFATADGVAVNPAEALGAWHDLINEILAGYDCIPLELQNDLDIVRRPLESVLNNEELLTSPEHAVFVQQIQALDEVFKSFSVEHPEWSRFPHRQHWWEGRVLIFAKEDYRMFSGLGENLEWRYGIKIRSER